jgi:hypothetical protein
MKLGQNACLGNCFDEFDGSGEGVGPSWPSSFFKSSTFFFKSRGIFIVGVAVAVRKLVPGS